MISLHRITAGLLWAALALGWSQAPASGAAGAAVLAPGTPASGALDPTFSSNGWLVIGEDAEFVDMAVQPDGKILILASRRNDSGNLDIYLLRYNPNGSLDSAFSGDGRIIATFGSGQDDIPAALILRPDGKIVVVAWASIGGQAGIGLKRFLSNGDLDTTFNGDGMAFADVAPGAAWFFVDTALRLSSGALDGRILVGGSYRFYDDQGYLWAHTFLAAFLPGGGLDTAWADGGVAIDDDTTHFMGSPYFSDLAATPAGFILVGKSSTEDYTYWLDRVYGQDGSFADSFINPIGIDACFDCTNWAGAVEVQPDGKTLILGQQSFDPPIGYDVDHSLFIIRHNPDWSVDTVFGDGGGLRLVNSYVSPGESPPSFGLALLPDGRILAGGGEPFGVFRLLPGGALDAGFGEDGRVATAIFSGDFTAARTEELALTPDGKIVAAGPAWIPDVYPIRYRIAVARYLNGGGEQRTLLPLVIR